MTSNHNPQTILYFFNGWALFISKSTETAIHEHHLVQIIISFEYQFSLKQNKGWHTYKAAILDSDLQHQFNSNGNMHVILLLDCI